jgi:15-cis-phytoene synthase
MVINEQLANSYLYEERQPFNPESAFFLAEQSIRQNSKTFYFATALLPKRQRRAIRALYAFCRASDDLVDMQGATQAEVERWRAAVRQLPEKQTHPLLYVWALIRQEYQVDLRYQEELINGVASDIQPVIFHTWDQLQNYCYQVASTVGLLSIPIVGLRKGASFEQAAPYAIKLGIALQLTNILRDIGEDARRGKVYLPEEDLQRFNLRRADILNGVDDERFVTLVKCEIRRARSLYRQSLPGIALLSASGQLAVGAAALLYRAILDEIEAIGYRVQQRRAHTSGGKKLALLPKILLTVLSLHPPA